MESTATQTPVSTIAEIGKHEGQTVSIRGWLYNLRESGKLLFPIFRDGSGQIQGVVPKNAVPPEVFEAIKGLTQESSVIVEGKVRADKRAPGGYELDVSNIQVLQKVAESNPYGASPSVGAQPASGGDSAGTRGNHQGGTRLSR
jgi:asparaginyl-tRNA synthetase